MKKRIVWLDIIKGFLILTVMLGHISQTPEWFKIWIYSFHLPLFFFLSGVTLSIEKYDFKSFVKRKVRTLIVPGFIFDFFIIVINVSLGNLHVTINNIIIGVILQMRGIRTDIAWFLILLFMSEIILYLVIKLFKEKQRKIIVFLFFMSALNYICLKIAGIFFNLIILPYSIDLIFMILPFVYAGYLYKTGKLIINENWTFLVLSIIMGNMLCFISFKVLGYCFDLYAGKFGSFLLYYLTAYAQINWLVIIFRKIKKAKLLSFIGRNSIIFYVWHALSFLIFDMVVADRISEQYLVLILKMTAGIFMLSMLSIIINKYFPFILGREKEIK